MSMFISFEGGEGGGKTTQIARIAEKLRQAGHVVTSIREPGGSKIAEQIRSVVLSPEHTDLAMTTEVFLFQAARAQVFHEIVIPALERGEIVLADRTGDSSVVYQGIVRGFGEDLIDTLNEISMQKRIPKLTFLLDVPVEVGFDRIAQGRGLDRMESEGKSWHKKIRQAYLKLAKKDQKRWRVIDASQPVDSVTQEIWTQLDRFLNSPQNSR